MFQLSLSVKDLDVTRGGGVVAEGISFALNPGDGLALRGQNGSGKTSVLRTIAGFAAPARGHIQFLANGHEMDASEARALHLHWLGGDDGLADRMTVAETVLFWSRLYGSNRDAISAVLSRLRLDQHEASPAGKLSTGQRRRLGLSRLLIAPRAIWLLDEPMSGLDDVGRMLMLETIEDHRSRGGIALMATHEEGLANAPVLRLRQMEPSS